MNSIRRTASVVAACATVALPLLAAEKLAAKTGLWETTATMNTGGVAIPALPSLPPEVLANLPAEQRALMEQARKMASRRPVTVNACVTAKDLAEGAFLQLQQQQDVQCKITIVASTPTRQETTFQCSSPLGPADGRMLVEVIDPGHVKGTVQVKAEPASVDTKFESKWLGADCGAAK